KDREKSHAHHAIDALIVAAIGKMSIFDFFTEFDMNETGAVVNRETGEMLPEKEMFNSRFTNFLSRLRNYESEVKYSHTVDRKANQIGRASCRERVERSVGAGEGEQKRART